MPARIFPSVLFPAPFSPHTAWQLAPATEKLTSSSATMPGKRLEMPRSSTVSIIPLLRQCDVLGIDVRKSPRLELPRPRAEVVPGDADEIHLHVRGDLLLVVYVIEDRPHGYVAPEIR